VVEFVVPRLHRAVVNESSNSLTITVPPRRRVPAILFGAVYLAIMGALARQAWRVIGPSFDAGVTGVGDVILYGFLVVFALFTVNGIYSLLFELWGIEAIASKQGHLRLQRTVFGIGHRASYPWEAVEHLRVLDLSAGPFMRGWGIGKSLNGRAAFDHGAQLIRFGDDLDVDEAARVVQLLDGHSMEKSCPSPGAV
jgi:hypothetical protein